MKYFGLPLFLILFFCSQFTYSQNVVESAKKDDLYQLNTLISSGGDVNEKDTRGMTPLLWAVQNGDSAAVALLLRHGADPNAAMNAGKKQDTSFTPLTLASNKGNALIVKALLNNGANVNDKVRASSNWDEHAERTALMLAAQNGFVEIVKILLENNADVNQHGKFYHVISYYNSSNAITQERNWVGDAETALMLAVRNNRSDVVKLLLGKGAEVNYQNEVILPERFTSYRTEVSNKSMKKHETALLIAAAVGDTGVVRMLLDAKAKIDVEDELQMNPILNAAYYGHPGVLEILISNGCNINKNGGLWDGNALTWATSGGDTNTILFLLARGMDINSTTNNNSSALMIAADQGRTPALNLLLNRKASIEWTNRDNQTALFRACIYGHTQCVKDLLAAGARVDGKDNKDKTPLMYATQRASNSIVDLLTKAGEVK